MVSQTEIIRVIRTEGRPLTAHEIVDIIGPVGIRPRSSVRSEIGGRCRILVKQGVLKKNDDKAFEVSE